MQEYTITSDSGMETTVLLSDEDAKARGLTATKASSKAKQQPANKQATPENKSASADKRAEAVSRAMNKPKA